MSSHDWQIEKSKITDYLLNERHPQGKAKALWFQSHGFHRKKWRVLSNSIRALLENRESEVMTKSPFGYRIVIRGTIPTPEGNPVRITGFFELVVTELSTNEHLHRSTQTA